MAEYSTWVRNYVCFTTDGKPKWPKVGQVVNVYGAGRQTRLVIQVDERNKSSIINWLRGKVNQREIKTYDVLASRATLLRSEVVSKVPLNWETKIEIKYQPIPIEWMPINSRVTCFGEVPLTGVLKWTGTVGPAHIFLQGLVDFGEDTNLGDNLLVNIGGEKGILLNLFDLILENDYIQMCYSESSVPHPPDVNSLAFTETEDETVTVGGTIVKQNEPCPVMGKIINQTQLNGEECLLIAFEEPVMSNFKFEHGAVPEDVLPITRAKPCFYISQKYLQHHPTEFQIFKTQKPKNLTSSLTPMPHFPLHESIYEKTISQPITCQEILGAFVKNKGIMGIQGSNNSCYLDVTFFCMFAFLSSFDSILEEPLCFPTTSVDLSPNEKCRQVLRHVIVNPLRKSIRVLKENICIMRQLLDTCGKTGLCGNQMDVEDFIHYLLDEVFSVSKYIHYSHDQQDFIHVILSGDRSGENPCRTVTTLLRESFELSQIQLSQVPAPMFLIQMPVSGGKLVQEAKYIIPNLELDVKNLLACDATVVDDTVMDLVAVICLHSSHYTCFAKTGEGQFSHWVYFDSRPSEKFPTMTLITNLPENILKLERANRTKVDPVTELNANAQNAQLIQHLVKHVYMCFYKPRSCR